VYHNGTSFPEFHLEAWTGFGNVWSGNKIEAWLILIQWMFEDLQCAVLPAKFVPYVFRDAHIKSTAVHWVFVRTHCFCQRGWKFPILDTPINALCMVVQGGNQYGQSRNSNRKNKDQDGATHDPNALGLIDRSLHFMCFFPQQRSVKRNLKMAST